MKTKLMLLLMLISSLAFAQNAKLEKALLKNLANSDTAASAESWQTITNNFERIANAETTEWLAQYYAAYGNIITGMFQPGNDKKDEYYDKALSYIAKASELKPDNSEVLVLKSWTLGMKIGVDPMNRGMKLGPESGTTIGKAKELDPENPRVYLMMGQSAMYTPEQFGGGKAKALPLLETAVEKFKVFKPSEAAMPNWGQEQAIKALEQCQKM